MKKYENVNFDFRSLGNLFVLAKNDFVSIYQMEFSQLKETLINIRTWKLFEHFWLKCFYISEIFTEFKALCVFVLACP